MFHGLRHHKASFRVNLEYCVSSKIEITNEIHVEKIEKENIPKDREVKELREILQYLRENNHG